MAGVIRFTTLRYRDYGTGRSRWGVLGPSGVWYFPTRYGYRNAAALCNRLNREVLR